MKHCISLFLILYSIQDEDYNFEVYWDNDKISNNKVF
jgi:hypothetical protein